MLAASRVPAFSLRCDAIFTTAFCEKDNGIEWLQKRANFDLPSCAKVFLEQSLLLTVLQKGSSWETIYHAELLMQNKSGPCEGGGRLAPLPAFLGIIKNLTPLIVVHANLMLGPALRCQ